MLDLAGRLVRTVGVEPSPQSIVAVYELSVSGSVNWPSRAIGSPSVTIVGDTLKSAAVNWGATLLTVTVAEA